MRKFLLSTAAIAMVLGFASVTKAAETGDLDISIEFESSASLSQSAPLKFGKVDLSHMPAEGGKMFVYTNGDTSGSDAPTTGAQAGVMLLTDPSATLFTNLQGIEVNGVVLDNGSSYTVINPIALKQGEVVCGKVQEMAVHWDPSELDRSGKAMPIYVGGVFQYTGAQVKGECTGTATLTTVY